MRTRRRWHPIPLAVHHLPPRKGEDLGRGGHDLDTLPAKILVTLGSAASIGFGVWHFFVPRLWNWYSYIDASATELVVAIRAINVFFSLSLVLFGLMNLLLAYGPDKSRYAALVVLGATCVSVVGAGRDADRLPPGFDEPDPSVRLAPGIRPGAGVPCGCPARW